MTVTSMESATDATLASARACHPAAGGATTLLDGELLAEIAAGLGRGAPIETLPDGSHRRWSYVIRAEHYEALIIAWPPGTGLAMHDHGGSLAALHIIGGRLRERYIDAHNRTQVRWLTAGDTMRMDAHHAHEMINLDDSEAISVHVYSPPLADNSFRIDDEINLSGA